MKTKKCPVNPEEIPESPFYLFDEDILRSRIKELKEETGEAAEICYAVKANPFLLKTMDEQITKYEVCSPGELEICLQSGIAPEKIVFSGVNKGIEEIERAIDCGASVITAESLRQLAAINLCAKKREITVKVLPRLANGAQFGIDGAELQDVFSRPGDYGNLEFTGIQYFTGTQKKSRDKVLKELEEIVAYADMLEERYGFKAKVIEFGPGLSVPYFEEDDFEKGYSDYHALIEALGRHTKYRFVLEMGRYIAASCGFYVTKVVDIKTNGGRNYCLVDGGIHHVNYYGQNMAMRVPVIEHLNGKERGTEEEKGEKEWTICGSLCTFADLLVRKVSFTNLQAGDRLVFHNIGAYSITEGIYLFLSRSLPAVYLYGAEEGLRLIRRETATADFNKRGEY